MKAALVFLVVVLALSEAASLNKKHKAKEHARHEEVTDEEGEEDYEWPEADSVKNFGVPQEFAARPPPHSHTHYTHGYEESTPPSGKHGKNHKSHH